MQSALASLRDIEGIIGSFLLDERGNLLARDMPSMFDDDTLAFASARMGRLRAAFETGSERFEGCTARFGAHLIILRPAAARSLCVMCPVGTNMAMLEMGINLIARRLSAPKSEPQPGAAVHSHWTTPAPPQAAAGAGSAGSAGSHSLAPASASQSMRPSAPGLISMSPPPAQAALLPQEAPDEPDRESQPPGGEPTRLFRGRPLR